MNKNQNGYQNINPTSFFIRGLGLLNVLLLYDLGPKQTFMMFISSSDLYFIVKSKMDVILHIYYYNNDVILNTITSTSKHVSIHCA